MPERWERELAKLRAVEPRSGAVGERIATGPRDAAPRTARGRLAAGVVASFVAVAAIALVWRTLPRPLGGGAGTAQLPTLTVAFDRGEIVGEGSHSSQRRVETTISYGDALDESFTSTTPPGAIVDWVAAEDLTRFVPGPTVGSAVEFQADGDDARVLLGRPEDWPDFGRFERIDRLPARPGEYVLVFAADYPDGIARTARLMRIVEPGIIQLSLNEPGEEAVSGDAFLDGQRVRGHVASTNRVEGDVGIQTTLSLPNFGPDEWLRVPIGTRIVLAVPTSDAAAGLFRSAEAYDPNVPLPVDLLADGADVSGDAGRWLLAVEARWEHGQTGFGREGTIEEALFFFPIEIVADPEQGVPAETESPAPSVVVQASPSPSMTNGPTVEPAAALRVRCDPRRVEVLTPVVATQADGLHIVPVGTPADWEMFLFPAAEPDTAYAAGSDDTDDLFVRPVPPGDVSVGCLDRQTYTDVEMERVQADAASFVLVDPEGFFVPYVPECAVDERSFIDRHPGGIDVNAAERLRMLPGVVDRDVIEPAGYDRAWGGRRWWRIVRDGRIVAGLVVAEAGGGHVTGWVCVGSGIHA